MSVPPPEQVDQLNDGQVHFYLSEYQRVLRMFENYSSTEAHALQQRLKKTIAILERESKQRKHRSAA